MFASGLGAVEPEVATGSPAPFNPPAQAVLVPRVLVDGRPAEVRFAGLTPGFVGLYQVNFVVPAETRSGLVPLQIESGGVFSSEHSLAVGP